MIDLTLKKDLHKKIKFKERLLAKEIYESYKDTIFKKRFNIEGHFENLKNKFNWVTYEVAKVFVLLNFSGKALY